MARALLPFPFGNVLELREHVGAIECGEAKSGCEVVMAGRDKSQGFGFVYVDIRKLLEDAKNGAAENRPVESSAIPGAQVLNFPHADDAAALAPQLLTRSTDRQPVRGHMIVPSSQRASHAKLQQETVALRQIRENLDRLQELHRKLHAVLAELSDATDRDRRKP